MDAFMYQWNKTWKIRHCWQRLHNWNHDDNLFLSWLPNLNGYTFPTSNWENCHEVQNNFKVPFLRRRRKKKWLARACFTSKPNSSLNYTEKCPAAINHSCLKISIYYKTKLFFFQSFPFGGFFYGRHHISKENEGKIDWYARAAVCVRDIKGGKTRPP